MDELATDPARASQGRIVKLIPCDHCGEFGKLPGLKNVVSTVGIVFFFFSSKPHQTHRPSLHATEGCYPKQAVPFPAHLQLLYESFGSYRPYH